jgi:hypothetical protein
VPFASNGAVKALLGDGSGDMLEMSGRGAPDTQTVHGGARGGTHQEAEPGTEPGAEPVENDTDTLIRMLVARGVSGNQIVEIVGGRRGEVLAKVREAKAATVGAAE